MRPATAGVGHLGILARASGGQFELRVLPATFSAAFGHIPDLLSALRAAGALVCDATGGARLTAKRPTVPGAAKARYHVIRIDPKLLPEAVRVLRLAA